MTLAVLTVVILAAAVALGPPVITTMASAVRRVADVGSSMSWVRFGLTPAVTRISKVVVR